MQTLLGQLKGHRRDLLLGEFGNTVQVLDLRGDAELIQVETERVQAIDNSGHVFPVVDVRCLGEKYLGQADVLHRLEPMVDVIGVSELKAEHLILALVLVEDLLEGHLFRTEEVGQLS